MTYVDDLGVVMVRGDWPHLICPVTKGEHGWRESEHGVICASCRELVPWGQCAEYQNWCFYLMVGSHNVDRLN